MSFLHLTQLPSHQPKSTGTPMPPSKTTHSYLRSLLLAASHVVFLKSRPPCKLPPAKLNLAIRNKNNTPGCHKVIFPSFCFWKKQEQDNSLFFSLVDFLCQATRVKEKPSPTLSLLVSQLSSTTPYGYKHPICDDAAFIYQVGQSGAAGLDSFLHRIA